MHFCHIRHGTSQWIFFCFHFEVLWKEKQTKCKIYLSFFKLCCTVAPLYQVDFISLPPPQEDNAPLESHLVAKTTGLPIDGTNIKLSSGVHGNGGCDALCRYVLFMQTTQRLTRVWRFPAFSVSDWGFLQSHVGGGDKGGDKSQIDSFFWCIITRVAFAGINLYLNISEGSTVASQKL